MRKLPKRTTSPKKASPGSRRSLPRAGSIRRGRGGGFKIIKETGRRSSGNPSGSADPALQCAGLRLLNIVHARSSRCRWRPCCFAEVPIFQSDKYVNLADPSRVTTILRHTEIADFLARKICRQLGIPDPK